jgi:hypothetical protein
MANLSQIFPAASSNNIIEMIESPADGRSIQAVSGTYVMENAAVQALNNTYTDIVGSKINYTPPDGTKYIHYNFMWKMNPLNYSGLSHYRLYVAGVEVNEAFRTYSGSYYTSYSYNQHLMNIGYVFDLTASSDNVAVGQFNGWSGAKEIVAKGRRYSSTYTTELHKNRWWDGTGSNSYTNYIYTSPILKIVSFK